MEQKCFSLSGLPENLTYWRVAIMGLVITPLLLLCLLVCFISSQGQMITVKLKRIPFSAPRHHLLFKYTILYNRSRH